jgi:GntR family transcriptional repressor for pyruvate dehydrogenase complex
MTGYERIHINREPLAAEVVRQIIDRILGSEMNTGDRLPSERNLADMLGVGRSVIREALKTLTVLGLIEVRQGDGTYLSRPDTAFLARAIEWGLLLGAHEALELVEARCHLEEIIAMLAAARRTDEDVEELRRLLAEMEVSQGDLDRFVNADLAFHTKVSEACGNGTLQRMMAGITMLLQVWIRRVMRKADSYAPTLEEHRQLFAAIEAGDEDAARLAAAAHMSRARSRLESSLTLDEDEVERTLEEGGEIKPPRRLTG